MAVWVSRFLRGFRNAIVLAVVLVGVGCGSDPTGAASTTVGAPGPLATVPATGVVVAIIALDNSFRSQVTQVAVGDDVRWENRGIQNHDIASVNGTKWGVAVEEFEPGDAFAYRFSEPGVYNYYCTVHGNETVGMVGTIVVSP